MDWGGGRGYPGAGFLQYLVKRSVSVSPRGGGAAGGGRGDLAVGALLPGLFRHRGEECVAAAGCHLTTHTHQTHTDQKEAGGGERERGRSRKDPQIKRSEETDRERTEHQN